MSTFINSEVMQDLSRGSPLNSFTFTDHAIVRKAMARLEGEEYAVVRLRFWENNSLSEIAEIRDLTWSEVETYLTQALMKLKAMCLGNSEFSRAMTPGGNKYQKAA